MTLGCLLASLPGEERDGTVGSVVLEESSQMNVEVARKFQDLS